MPGPTSNPQVTCIVVTYRPRLDTLRAALDSISAQASRVIVVDNTESSDALPHIGSALYLPLGGNRGIAAAQNRGIALALSLGADYIWLSDQDTVYPRDFLARMLACADRCTDAGIRYAALAPVFFDVLADTVRPFIRHAPFIQAFEPVPGMNLIADAIASGTLIPSEVLSKVGPMQEDLFVDWVDTEWCWRARNLHGLSIVGVGDVVIRHGLGDSLVAFGRRRITIRSPSRHYYIIRNAVYLALHSEAPTWPIRLQIVFRALLWTAGYPMVAAERKWEHARACCRGLWHGFTKRMGPCP